MKRGPTTAKLAPPVLPTYAERRRLEALRQITPKKPDPIPPDLLESDWMDKP